MEMVRVTVPDWRTSSPAGSERSAARPCASVITFLPSASTLISRFAPAPVIAISSAAHG